jgi:hypothetical protein
MSRVCADQGVAEDAPQALTRFKKVAGLAEAHNYLGSTYALGKRTQQDDVLVHMWFHLASRELPLVERNREAVSKHMTSQQIEQVIQLAKQ